jgi:hypothetical protein
VITNKDLIFENYLFLTSVSRKFQVSSIPEVPRLKIKLLDNLKITEKVMTEMFLIFKLKASLVTIR